MTAGTVLDDRPAASFTPVADPRSTLRRLRFPLILVAVVVVVSLLLALVEGTSNGNDLDPASYSQGGTRALATLLAGRGSPVTRVQDVPSTGAGAIVVPDSSLLSPTALTRAEAAASRATVLIVVGDDGYSDDALGATSGVDGVGDPTAAHDPSCDLPAAVTAGRSQTGPRSFQTDPGSVPPGFRLAADCYDDTVVVLTPVDGGSGHLVLLGSSAFLTNMSLASQGNASLALGLLDAAGPVAWVQPTPGSAAAATGEDGSSSVVSLLPHRLKVAAWELGVVVALLALWRGRRLGPVVQERLPVVVRTAETVRGRARLYRGADARDRAALALREGTRARLATRLGLGPETTPGSLVEAVAARSGRTATAVGTLLYGSGAAPADDPALVRLADELDALVREASA